MPHPDIIKFFSGDDDDEEEEEDEDLVGKMAMVGVHYSLADFT